MELKHYGLAVADTRSCNARRSKDDGAKSGTEARSGRSYGPCAFTVLIGSVRSAAWFDDSGASDVGQARSGLAAISRSWLEERATPGKSSGPGCGLHSLEASRIFAVRRYFWPGLVFVDTF